MRNVMASAAWCDQMLVTLIAAAGLDKQSEEILHLFETISVLGNVRNLPPIPRWSGVTDDCSPIEFSLALSGARTCVRFLVEAQTDRPSAMAYWEAAGSVTQYAADRFGAELDRLRAIRDLFIPSDPNATFAAWHAVEFSAGRRPLFKIYLNLAAQGRQRARSLLREALDRLGYGEIMEGILALCPTRDMPTHLCLDLSSLDHARVKVYIRHFHVSAGELNERVARLDTGMGTEFGDVCAEVCAVPDVLWRRPVMTCYQLTAVETRQSTQSTLYIPLHPYATSDGIAYSRLLNLLNHFGISTRAYSQAYAAFTRGEAEVYDGLHSYVAYKGRADEAQINIYFSPRLFQRDFGRLALDPPRQWPSPVI